MNRRAGLLSGAGWRPPKAPASVASAIGGGRSNRRGGGDKEGIEDPSPQHLNVSTGNDDLCSFVSDFSSSGVDDGLYLEDGDNQLAVIDDASEAEDTMSRDPNRIVPWENHEAPPRADDEAPLKSCMPMGLFRRRKVSCADVASVSVASDTLVSVSSRTRVSGRDLHESAKENLNAGELWKALFLFEAIEGAQVKRFGSLHPSVGAAIHNVGVVRLRLGHFEQAETLFSDAVSIRQQALGNDHLDVAASLLKLGSAKVAMHKFDEALSDLREALRIAQTNLGTRHKTVAQTLCHLANLYFEAGEFIAAQATFADALDIYRVVWRDEPDQDSCRMQLSETLCNIGSIQNKRKNFKTAVVTFTEALDLQRQIVGEDHPRVISTLDNLGFSHSRNKDYHQALTCYKEMLRVQIANYGTFNQECCETLKKVNLLQVKLHNLRGAVEDTKHALRIQQNMSPSNPTVITQTKNMLALLERKIEKENGGDTCACF